MTLSIAPGDEQIKISGHAKAGITGENAIDKNLGRRLHLRRTLCGLSGRELSEKLQIDPKELDAYERGIKRITANLLLRTAEVLEVRCDYFFRGYTTEELGTLGFE